MAEAYCNTCKTKVEVLNPQRITKKNGKPDRRADRERSEQLVIDGGAPGIVVRTSRTPRIHPPRPS